MAGDVNGIAKRYGLTVVKSLSGSASGHHVLASRGAIPAAVLRSLATEFAVSSAEVEKAVRLPGIKPAAPSPPRRRALGRHQHIERTYPLLQLFRGLGLRQSTGHRCHQYGQGAHPGKR